MQNRMFVTTLCHEDVLVRLIFTSTEVIGDSNMPRLQRLLVSQDRHEIFLAFATYDSGYLDKLLHMKPPPENK